MLTQKQYDLLLFIAKRLNETSVSPSFDEMRQAVGLKSKSGIHRLIKGLEERRFVRHLPNRARALEVLRLPEKKRISADMTGHAGAFQTLVGGKAKAPVPYAAVPVTTVEMTQVPLFGKIAAGVPIEAIRDMETTVPVPPQMLGVGEHYALKVEGDSMINAGILDGDTVIIQRTPTAENGTIVVALVDGFEVTLKRLRRKGETIALEPENPHYQTRILPAHRVAVQGRLVGLMRNY